MAEESHRGPTNSLKGKIHYSTYSLFTKVHTFDGLDLRETDYPSTGTVEVCKKGI
jgi:hypothetical protein